MNPSQLIQKFLQSRYNVPGQVGAVLGMNPEQKGNFRNSVDTLLSPFDPQIPQTPQWLDQVELPGSRVPLGLIKKVAQGYVDLPSKTVGSAAKIAAARNPWEAGGDALNIGTGVLAGAEGLHAFNESVMPELQKQIAGVNESGGVQLGPKPAKVPSMRTDVNDAYNSGNITAQEAKLGYGIKPLAKQSVDPLTLHPDYFASDSLKRGADVIENMKGKTIYTAWKNGEADQIPGIGEGIVRRLDLIFKDGPVSNAKVAETIRMNIPAESAITPLDMKQAGEYTRWQTLNQPAEDRASNMWVNEAAKIKVKGDEVPKWIAKNLPDNWEEKAVELGYDPKLFKSSGFLGLNQKGGMNLGAEVSMNPLAEPPGPSFPPTSSAQTPYVPNAHQQEMLKNVSGMTPESIINATEGFAPGQKQAFDVAAMTKNIPEVERLLPQMPAEYITRFAGELTKLLGRVIK